VGEPPHAQRHPRSAGTRALAGATAATDAGSRAAPRPNAVAGSDAPAARTAPLSASALTEPSGLTPREERERPLGAYAFLTVVFTTGFGIPLVLAERRGSLPERVAAADLTLLAVGTFKLSRMLTRDAVTGFVRAPFVDFEGMESVTTPKEKPHGRGLRRAVGQLLLCPGCVGAWTAASLTAALLGAPRPTRVVCAALTAFAGSDFLQAAHGRITRA